MYVLESLELEGFGPFKQRQTITFPKTGLIQINGRIGNTFLSSGSGKSSLINAITYSFGFCDIPATELKNWGSKKLYVKLTVFNELTNSRVSFIHDPKFSMEIDGKVIKEGVEEELKTFLKIHPDLAEALTYRRQREKGQFITKTDAQRKEFLSKLLGLEKFEEAGAVVQSDISKKTTIIAGCERSIPGYENIVATMKYNEADITAAQTKVNDLIAQYNQIKSETNTNSIAEQIQSIATRINQLEQLKNTISHNEMLNNSDKERALKLKAEIEKIAKEGNCPTCSQKWDQAQTLKTKMEADLKSIAINFQTRAKFIADNKAATEEIPALREQKSKLDTQLAGANAPLQTVAESYNTAKALLDNLNRNKASFDTASLNLTREKELLATTKAELEVLNHVGKIIHRNGFMSVIFDELLGEIEHKTNQMMAGVPNIENITIAINSTAETKAGTIQKKIGIVFTKKGKEISFKGGMSGGQQAAVEACVDLAISQCIKKRSGSPLNWIILDEAFDGLCVENKKHIVEVISREIEGQIFVVDHSTEIKEGFAQVIQVKHDGNESVIVS